MDRKFKKKAGPFGTPPPPKPNVPSNGPVGPANGLGGPGGPPTPPGGSEALTSPPGGSEKNIPADTGLRPRQTPPSLMTDEPVKKEDVPTDVHIDAATGEVSISKGPLFNLRIAEENPLKPEPANPNQFPVGSPCQNCGGAGVYMGKDCGTCGGGGVVQNEGDIDPWNYTHAPKENYDQRVAKIATHQDWKDFKANDNELQYGDWSEPELARDTHDNPFAAPANRLKPPLFTVTGKVPEYMNVRNIAYVLQTSTMLDVEVSGQTLTITGVANPLSLISELESYGIDASTEDLMKYPQGFDDFLPGQKVALLGDYPGMNYYYSSNAPAAQAKVVGKTDNSYILENDMWGRFEARKDELGHV